jgi:pyridoxal phosphate-dependent aminotransferase EpsN
VSNNYRLAEIPAILGHYQLKDLPGMVERRNEISRLYRKMLSDVDGLELLPECNLSTNSYWRFPAYLKDGIDRQSLQEAMRANHGVRITWMYEPLCHLQPLFVNRYGNTKGDFPVAEHCMDRLICLPAHLRLPDEDIIRVCDGLKKEISVLEK